MAAFLVATACTTGPAGPAAAGDELIVYETHPGPFCGRCDNIKITAASGGRVWIERGHWAGRYRNWRVERRRTRVSPEKLASFRARLAPYRPASGSRFDDPDNCAAFFSDMPEIQVSWREGGAETRLGFNYGCDPEKRADMARALSEAPFELGIRDLPTPSWVATTPM